MSVFWVECDGPGRMAIVARPRGGDWLEQELSLLKQAGIDVLVSMLEPAEAAEMGLNSEAEIAQAAGLQFLSWPLQDRQTPESVGRMAEFAQRLAAEMAAGRTIATHCRASIGRATLVLACVLCVRGMSTAEAFRRLQQARGVAIPDTPEQRAWVERFALFLQSRG